MKLKKNSNQVFPEDFYDKVRERFGITKSHMTDFRIRALVRNFNKEIAKWVVDNADGFKLHKEAGVLIISKYKPKIFHEDKEEMMENLKTSNLPEWKKAIIFKKYNKFPEIHHSKNKNYLKRYFFDYNAIWFNVSNCNFRKASCYKFSMCDAMTDMMVERVNQGKEYFEWQAEDFKLRGIDSVSRSVKRKRAMRNKRKALAEKNKQEEHARNENGGCREAPSQN